MTSHALTHDSHNPSARPLRLRLSASPGEATLDGGWWPHSRDIDVELADLVDGLPVDVGRVNRALYSRPDWDTRPHSVRVLQGRLKTGSFPGDNTHVIVLSMSTGLRLTLLVVPPDQALGDEAMEVAAWPANRSSATEILASFGTEDEGTERREHWTDDGGSWWSHEDGPPSFRRGAPG